MDLLDRLLGHDAWTTRQLLLLSQPLTDAQLDQDFDIAHRTVRRTFVHMIANMECWSNLMFGATHSPRSSNHSVPALLARLDQAAAYLAQVTRPTAHRQAWDDQFLDILDDRPRQKTYGGAIAHIITHSMHHRAQLLFMLRRLGVQNLPEGDALTWENQLPKKF